MSRVRFCPIASGSSGNCAYFGTSDTHILIDAGLSGKQIESGLRGLGIGGLSGILVTHEHGDHISGIGVMARRFKVPIYASPKTWRYLLRHDKVGAIDRELQRCVYPGEKTRIGDIDVVPFDIPHDASQPVGYSLIAEGCKVTVATDIGYVTDTVREHIRGSNILLLESNHDIEMLKNGRYHQALKERVMGNLGHLSNAAAGALLAESVSDSLNCVFLGHLSEENNLPLLALGTVQNILDANRLKLRKLLIADRYGPSELIEL